jgi:uncharacterized membrane protein YkvI
MNWLVLALLLLSTMMVAGCEVVEGIFKAGFWVGAIAVILIVAGIGFLAMKMKG